jgi:hypothetical protein
MAKGKVILKVGYAQFIMEPQAATALFQALAGTDLEIYESKWNNVSQTQEPRVKMATDDLITLSMITPEQYAMGKLLQKADILAVEEAKPKGEA